MRVYQLDEDGNATIRVRCDFCGVEHRLELQVFPSGRFVVQEKEGNCIVFQDHQDVQELNDYESHGEGETEKAVGEE